MHRRAQGRLAVLNGTLTDELAFADLIAFRNVAIHFERDASRALHERFVEALRIGGILFLGGAESLFSPERLGLRQMSHCCYAKEDVGMSSGNERRLAS